MLLFKAAILVVALAILVGWFHQHLEEFFRWALSLLQEPFHLLSDGLATVMTSLRNWIRAQLGYDRAQDQAAERAGEPTPSGDSSSEWNPLEAHGGTTRPRAAANEGPAAGASERGVLSPRRHLQYIIGGILYTAAFLAFVYADFWLIVLTLQAFGLETVATRIPASAALLTAAAFIGVAVFWGLVLLDLLGVTHLAPWDRLGIGARRMMIRIAWTCIGLSLILCLLFGIWRGITSSESLPTQTSEAVALESGGIEVSSPGREASRSVGGDVNDFSYSTGPGGGSTASRWEASIPVISLGLLPVLVSISAVWSGIGVATLIHYLAVILAGVILIPLALLNLTMRIMMALCNAAFGAIQAILRLLHSMGRGLIEFLRPLYNWLQNRMKRSLGEGGSSAPFPPAQAGVREPPIIEPDGPASDSPDHTQTGEPDETDGSDEAATAWNPFAMTGGPR
jgi:hypothetical protein